MIEALKDCIGGQDNVWVNMAKNECFLAFMNGANACSYTMMGNIKKQFTSDLYDTQSKLDDVEDKLTDILALIQIMNDNGIISSDRIMKRVPNMYKEIEDALNKRIYSEQEALKRYREHQAQQELQED